MPHAEMFEQLLFYLMPVAVLFLEGYCLYRFAEPFMVKKRAALSAALSYLLVMCILYAIPFYLHYYIAYIAGNLAAFFVLCIMDGRNYRQKVFIVATCLSVGRFASVMAEIVYDNLYEFILTYARGMDDYLNTYVDVAIYIGVCVIYLIIDYMILYAGMKIILKVYKEKYADMKKSELFISVIPSFTGITGYWIMCYYRNFYIRENGSNADVYDVLTLLYCLVSVITIIAVAVLYQSIRSRKEDDMHISLLAAQIDSMRRHFESVEGLYRDIRGIRHDMAAHVITLERLYAGDKASEAKDYLAGLKAELSNMSGDIKSGNPVTDVILKEIKNEADKRNINFSSEFYFPEDSSINAFDISIILNNALQNAMESIIRSISVKSAGNNVLDSNPYISVSSYRRNNAYMIEIRNSYLGTLQWNTDSGLPVTSKDDAGCHGYGLSNIRRVAHKYSGDIDISAEDGEFCLCIMLMTVG